MEELEQEHGVSFFETPMRQSLKAHHQHKRKKECDKVPPPTQDEINEAKLRFYEKRAKEGKPLTTKLGSQQESAQHPFREKDRNIYNHTK